MNFKEQSIRDRYAAGRPVSEIAAAFKLSEGAVYKTINSDPDLKEKDKTSRDIARGMKFHRAEMLATDQTITKLENGEIDDPKELCQIAKVFGDKANLAEGKATERVENFTPVTPEERKKYLTEELELLEDREQAGTAIAEG